MLIIFLASLALGGCGGPVSTFSDSATPAASAFPTSSPEPAPAFTLTPVQDFYTPEELNAASSTWNMDSYDAPTAREDGSVLCKTAPGREMRFALNEAEEKARFSGSYFIKVSDNLWRDEFTRFGVGGVTYTRTLAITETELTETTVLLSPSGKTATCTNLWQVKP